MREGRGSPDLSWTICRVAAHKVLMRASLPCGSTGRRGTNFGFAMGLVKGGGGRAKKGAELSPCPHRTQVWWAQARSGGGRREREDTAIDLAGG